MIEELPPTPRLEEIVDDQIVDNKMSSHINNSFEMPKISRI